MRNATVLVCRRRTSAPRPCGSCAELPPPFATQLQNVSWASGGSRLLFEQASSCSAASPSKVQWAGVADKAEVFSRPSVSSSTASAALATGTGEQITWLVLRAVPTAS